ncbi:hypothetical protein IMZ48_37670, partial [Candidatus Bathyarchaeota archaeon]|nr:hypothetical protein [Candidatus Bathyarchaeota archaeon]
VGQVERLSDTDCLLATPYVTGLDLKTNEWGMSLSCFHSKAKRKKRLTLGLAAFRVSDLSPVSFNDDAFDNLVIPNDTKQLAWTAVRSQILQRSLSNDFILGKGAYLRATRTSNLSI